MQGNTCWSTEGTLHEDTHKLTKPEKFADSKTLCRVTHCSDPEETQKLTKPANFLTSKPAAGKVQ